MTNETSETGTRPFVNVKVGTSGGVRTGDSGRERVVWGLLLMAGGVLFLLDQMGVVQLPPIWNWWPAIFFAIGLPKFFSPREWPNGITMILLGLTFFAIMEHWWGLGWSTGWPLFLVITGLEIMIKAFFVERREETRDA
jgi:hypothetical protein